MGALRDAMAERLAVSGLAEKTRYAYLQAVKRLTEHYWTCEHSWSPPDKLTDDQVRQYFVHLVKNKRISNGYFKLTKGAVAFFYREVCGRTIPGIGKWKGPRRTTVPQVMSFGEVRRVIGIVHDPIVRTCLLTAYACGLRAGEATKLVHGDIDAERGVIHIREAKGGKDRLVPMSQTLLAALRECWLHHRHPRLVFPSADGKRPVHVTRVSEVFQTAAAQARIRRHVTLHTLRHSYATHLLEAGHDLRIIQHLLGHSRPETTSIYTHVGAKALEKPLRTIDRMLQAIVRPKND